MKLLRALMLVILLAAVLMGTKPIHAQDTSPWGEILNPDGSIQWDKLTDLGNTSQSADWMTITLPGGLELHPDATYHRYQTPSGNVLVLPSPATLFFMAMHPQESGLSSAQSMLGDGAAMLMLLAGPSLDQQQLETLVKMGYTDPKEFFQAVIDGKANIWSIINVNFFYEIFNMSYQSGFLVNALLLYLNGAADCANIPGGCAGLIAQCPGGSCLPKPGDCPLPTIAQGQPTIDIQKIAPDHPLVIGQDPARRGADIRAAVSIPPVIFTWYEQVKEPPKCEYDGSGNGQGCSAPGDQYQSVSDANGNSISWSTSMENSSNWKTVDGDKRCIKHVEKLPEIITQLQANAQLSADSQSWILNDLAGKYYEAYIHQASFNLLSGQAEQTNGCDGNKVCSATALASNVPFADPGTFDLKLWAYTAGTTFSWKGVNIPITQPRVLFAQNAAQIYVTLVSLIP